MWRIRISVLVIAIVIAGIQITSAHPRPERIGLPPSPVGAEYLDEALTNDDSLHLYDIQHYDLHVNFNLTGQTINGDVSIHCVSTDNSLDEILLELLALTVDTVQVDGITSTFNYHNDSLFIPLAVPLPEGDSILVRVVYHGHPQHESWGGFWFQTQVTFSMGDGLYCYPPPYNHTWFPNWRHPADKATMEMWFTVPLHMVAASNGELIEVIENLPQQTVIWHWKQYEPVSSYLYCVAIANYAILTDPTYNWIVNYAYRADSANAVASFSNVHLMMDAFQERFGPYPYTGKFGYAMVGQGDMEHVGLVAHLAGLVNGGHSNDWILAHEMSHMWWGNMVTCGTWKDLWLNEGFGTYCEALYFEYIGGEDNYRGYMQSSLMQPYFSSGQLYPIYNPQQLWSTTVYEKGGCVMHMLRGVLGDSLFFAGWNEFGDQYRFDTATTEDFETVMEQVSGQELDWFFDEWIYGPGFPRYNYSWNAFQVGDMWQVRIQVDQTQTSGGPFTMPIDFGVVSAVDTVIQRCWIDTDPDTVWFRGGINQPLSVIFDYYNWVLDYHTEVPSEVETESPTPSRYSLHPAYPNPFNSSTVIEYTVPFTCRANLSIWNVLGQKVATLVDGEISAGEHRIIWNGKNSTNGELSSGVYLVGMTAPGYSKLEKVVLIK